MALISGMLGTVIVNFKALKGAGMMRVILIFMLVILFVLMLMLSSSQHDAVPRVFVGVSIAAEAGGLLAGLFLGMMLMPYSL